MRLDQLVLGKLVCTEKQRELIRAGLNPLAPMKHTVYAPLKVRRKRIRAQRKHGGDKATRKA